MLYNISSTYTRSSYSLKERAATCCPARLIGVACCPSSVGPLFIQVSILHSTWAVGVDTFGVNLARCLGTQQTDVKKQTVGVTLPAQTHVD